MSAAFLPLIALLGITTPADLATAARAGIPQDGYASRYDPGVLEGVVGLRWQNDWWRVTPPADWYTVSGYAATTDCGEVGAVVEMRPVGSDRWERILVADCAGRDSHWWMLDNRIAAELDYETFTRWAAAYGVPLAIEVRR